MLEKFERHTVQAVDLTVTGGHQYVDGTPVRFVAVDIDRERNVVTLETWDSVAVEIAVEPFAALLIGEKLINAGLAMLLGGKADSTD